MGGEFFYLHTQPTLTAQPQSARTVKGNGSNGGTRVVTTSEEPSIPKKQRTLWDWLCQKGLATTQCPNCDEWLPQMARNHPQSSRHQDPLKAATYRMELKRDILPARKTNQPQASRPSKRVDWASAALTVIGLLSSAIAYLLISNVGHNPLILAPGIVATTLGCTTLIVKEAPRFTQQTRTPAADPGTTKVKRCPHPTTGT